MNSTANENMEQEKAMQAETANNEPTTIQEEAQPQDDSTAEVELSKEEELQKSLDEANQQIAELQDKYLRLSAEFDNYRKRTLKEKAEIIKNGGEKTLTAILPVLDDLERALENMRKADDARALFEGVELINAKFHKTLAQEGLSQIETQDAPFNTDYHEAIAMVPAPSEELKGKILDCVQTGYMLHDKVIRHAKVAVAQ